MKIRVKAKVKPHNNNELTKNINKDVEKLVKEGYWHRDLVFHPSDESSIEYSCSCCGQSVCFASRY